MGLVLDNVRSGLAELSSKTEGPLKDTLDIVLHKLDHSEEEESLLSQMDAVYQARNLVRLAISGITIDDARLVQFANDSLQNVESLGIRPELIKSLAKSIFEAKKPAVGETIVIAGSKRNIEILEEIARLCVANGSNFIIDIRNDELDAVLVNKATDEAIAKLGQDLVEMYKDVKKRLSVRSNSSAYVDPEQRKKYMKAVAPLADRTNSNSLDFSYTMIPTEGDAEIDGIEYRDYLDLFFESCDQPWAEIHDAQQILIDKFNKGKQLHITNTDGTDLTMSIEGMTFANVGVDKNVPGSEFFSAPVTNSVSGKLVAKGNFKFATFPVIKNITFVFENGKIVSATAEEGEKTLLQILDMDEGSKFVGEIAFGTNPHLRRHLVNDLLVEKISGSFHVAVGNSYNFDDFEGVPITVNNGNRSSIHWDITTMLRGNGGRVELDGKLIQDNGIWINEDSTPDERLAVLSKGWGVLPPEKQPKWWKNKYPNGYID
jgi:aminopeptidase